MQRFFVPLRFSIPAILLVFGGLSGYFSFQKELSLSHGRIEENMLRQVKFSGDQTSGILEYLFRKEDVEGADLVVSKLGGNSNLRRAILCDENNKIILATRYELKNRSLVKIESAKNLSILERVRQTRGGQVILSADKQSIQAIYPVFLGAASGELRPTKVGILLLDYDLSEMKYRAYTDTLARSLQSSAVLAGVCIFIWFLFDKTVTRRATRLVEASNNLAKGKLTVRAGLQGSDEFAQISAAFDQMADKIETNQQELQNLVQREELLNRLANQIRNSLDLDTILETAVQEIRKLLQVDRASFFWYRPENFQEQYLEVAENLPQLSDSRAIQPSSLPYWELVHEAKHPDFPSLLGAYSVEAIGPLGKKVLEMKLLKINDVETLEEPIMQQLLRSLGHKALLVLPIQTHTGEVGAVTCGLLNASRNWSDSEVELLQVVTDQLAIAIDQAELYKQSRIAAATATHQAAQLQQTLQELQQTQSQLIQTEKMSSLGQMVAGVAHEINNPINFIYGNIIPAGEYIQDLLDLLRLYQMYYSQPVPAIAERSYEIDLDFLQEDLPKLLFSMQIGADRIRQIVLSLRNFSRLDEADMKPVDIHEGIDNTLLLLQNRLKAKSDRSEIKVVKQYGNLPLVECYAGQLNQVLMNLLANAIDAMDSDTTKQFHQITICTERSQPGWIVIKIADNGPGMTEEVKKCLFDPFFTTKPVGKGTGLGLSISYQIVTEKHRGAIKCESQLGQGTEFSIEIPLRQNSSNSVKQSASFAEI